MSGGDDFRGEFTTFVFQQGWKSATLKRGRQGKRPTFSAFTFNASLGTSASASFSVYSNFKRKSVNTNVNYLQCCIPDANPFPEDSDKNRKKLHNKSQSTQSPGAALGEKSPSCVGLLPSFVSAQSWMTMGPRILRLGWGCGGASTRPCGWPCETRRKVICSHGWRQACLSWERDSIRRALLEEQEGLDRRSEKEPSNTPALAEEPSGLTHSLR